MGIVTTEPTVACAGGCGQHKPLTEAATSGWELLPITGRYRCGQCSRELAEAGRLPEDRPTNGS